MQRDHTQFKGEQLRITIDPTMLSGEIYRLSAGKALVRYVHVFAKGRQSSTSSCPEPRRPATS